MNSILMFIGHGKWYIWGDSLWFWVGASNAGQHLILEEIYILTYLCVSSNPFIYKVKSVCLHVYTLES